MGAHDWGDYLDTSSKELGSESFVQGYDRVLKQMYAEQLRHLVNPVWIVSGEPGQVIRYDPAKSVKAADVTVYKHCHGSPAYCFCQHCNMMSNDELGIGD